ncbi:MAG: phosphotransferase, partial [Clostridia bacterium]|nr:phosphotransferase [Clostridia bacterium]
MYKVHTDSGVYALKLLNPFIMQRETAPENYARAEQLEAILEREGVPVLPALSFEGRKMQEIRGNFYYVFDYFPGKALNPGEITEYHCSEMGKVLAKIHGIDRKSENAAPSVTAIDWDFCLRELEKADTGLYAQLRGAMPAIESSQSKGNRAEKNLPPVLS